MYVCVYISLYIKQKTDNRKQIVQFHDFPAHCYRPDISIHLTFSEQRRVLKSMRASLSSHHASATPKIHQDASAANQNELRCNASRSEPNCWTFSGCQGR